MTSVSTLKMEKPRLREIRMAQGLNDQGGTVSKGQSKALTPVSDLEASAECTPTTKREGPGVFGLCGAQGNVLPSFWMTILLMQL